MRLIKPAKRDYKAIIIALVFLILLNSHSAFSQLISGTNIYYNNGNVGIGTTIPRQQLHLTGSLIIEGQYLYTGTGTSELNRYLQLLNSPDYGSATGLKAGGVLISDRYDYANPAKNDLIVKGNVGIGTANPTSKLQIGSYNFIKDGSWAAPAIPNTVSPGERISFYEGGGWKTALGMASDNGMWIQAHGADQMHGFEVFTGGNAVIPVSRFVILGNGNVGIGTRTPSCPLEIKTDYDNPLTFTNTDGSWQYLQFFTNTTRKAWMGINNTSDFNIQVENGGDFFLVSKNFKINGGHVYAREIKVTQDAFPDYVFNTDYKLPTLKEVESYINEHGHLPEIPSAKEVKENGLNLGEMNALMMQKIEELTLYIIELEKKVENLENKIE